MNVLIFGAHADDPEVSMGGTILKLTKAGHNVKLVICILPQENRLGEVIEGAKTSRMLYQKQAAKRLNCHLEILDLDPYQFQFDRKLVKTIDNQVTEFKPDVIFTHWNEDTHQDHKAVANATFAAARKNNVTVLMYEQLTLGGIGPFSFSSHVYVNISDVIEEKINAVKSYEFINENDIEAITSLAKFRGNQIGVLFAECFQVCKIITSISEKGFTLEGLWGKDDKRK